MSNHCVQRLDTAFHSYTESEHVKKCGLCWRPEHYSDMEPLYRHIILNTLLVFSRLKFRVPKFLRCHLIYLITSQFYNICTDVSWRCSSDLIITSSYLGQIRRPCCYSVHTSVKLNNSFYCKQHLHSITEIKTLTAVLHWSAPYSGGLYEVEETFDFVKKKLTNGILCKLKNSCFTHLTTQDLTIIKLLGLKLDHQVMLE